MTRRCRRRDADPRTNEISADPIDYQVAIGLGGEFDDGVFKITENLKSNGARDSFQCGEQRGTFLINFAISHNNEIYTSDRSESMRFELRMSLGGFSTSQGSLHKRAAAPSLFRIPPADKTSRTRPMNRRELDS
jgi:hypothetical protein